MKTESRIKQDFVTTLFRNSTVKAVLILLVIFSLSTVPVAASSSTITISTATSSVFIGDSFTVSGVNTDSDYVTLYMQGVNFELTPIVSQPVSVSADDTWTATIDSYGITSANGRKLDVGTYTITAVASNASIPEDPYEFIRATVALPFKQPFISITSAPVAIVQGTSADFVVKAEAARNGIQWYVFGTNYFNHGAVSDADDINTPNQFTVKFTEKNTDIAPGQYFAVFQHPMYDGLFNIWAYTDTGNVYYASTVNDGVYDELEDSMVLFNVRDRQTANAAQALCDALDSQNIDDMYVKYSFFIIGHDESFHISEIPGTVVKGNIIVISGVDTANAGEIVEVEMISTAFAAVPKETVGSESFINVSTEIAKDGTWEVILNTYGLNVDEYAVSVEINSEIRDSVFVNLIDPNEPVPTPTPTPTPTPNPTPDSSVFIYSLNDAIVTPSGALTVGQSVTAAMKVTVRGGSLDIADLVSLTTPLSNAKWSTDIYRGGVLIVSGYEYNKISGFMLESNSDLVLKISLSGTVSASSGGKEISVMNIAASADKSSISTKAQKVYVADTFAIDLAAAKKAAADLNVRSDVYAGYGIDTAAVNQYVAMAETKISAAESAGTANLATAYANIEAAKTYLKEAERDLALAGLNDANTNIGKITSIADTLYNRGMDSEALYLETKAVSLKYTYDILSAAYKDGGVPDAEELDSFLTDVQKTLKRANEYFPVYEENPNYVTLPKNLTLKNGWNFVSVPKTLATGTASATTLFAEVDTADNAILGYNASAQGWEQITASEIIKPLVGYWVYSNGTVDVPLSYVTDPTVPAVKQLYTGWNAVGVSAHEAVTADTVFSGTNWRVALPWNLSEGLWGRAVVNGGDASNSAEQYMTLGNGIWLYVDTNGTMIGLTA